MSGRISRRGLFGRLGRALGAAAAAGVVAQLGQFAGGMEDVAPLAPGAGSEGAPATAMVWVNGVRYMPDEVIGAGSRLWQAVEGTAP